MENSTFRKMGLADLDLVMQMEGDFRENFINKEAARRFLANPQNWLFCCVDGGRIVAFLYGYELNRLDKQGNMLYVHEVGVLPKYQRQGIGTAMLEKLKECCGLLGICRFFLFTQKSNEAACALYEKVGGVNGSPTDDDRSYFFKTN